MVSRQLNFGTNMKSFTGFFKVLALVIVILAVGSLVISNYEWVFSKNITGKVLDVQRVTDPSALVSARATEAQMHSYSILIQGEDGKLYTSASIDQQWQVVRKGYCVEALFYRNPPWKLDQANTFFNARVKQVTICPGETELPKDTQGPSGPPGDQQRILPAGEIPPPPNARPAR